MQAQAQKIYVTLCGKDRSWSISLDERIKKINYVVRACTRKGYKVVCKTTWIKFAINNERLRKRGLVFLLDQYTKVHIECTN